MPETSPPSPNQDPHDYAPEAYPDIAFARLYEQTRMREQAALERERAYREGEEYWYHEATRDQLTGLLNRRGLEEVLKDNPAPQALLFVDGNKIKAVNDTIGHERGDEAIKQLASLITSSIRPTDVAARVGGDEFVVILDPHKRADSEDAVSSPEHITAIDSLILATKKRFAQTTEALLARDDNADLRSLGFGLSIGSAVWHEGMTATDLIRIADADMYQAKRQQRRAEIPRRKRLAHAIGKRLVRYSGMTER